MLGDGGETPSRYELLSMVKKHSNLIGKTVVEEQDASDIEMDMKFWHDVFDLYFVRGKESRGRQDDDLVFFVRKLGSHGSGSNNKTESVDPYFVRRWAPKLSDLVDETSIDVDWRRSFYLNLIAHTSFSVTVAICSRIFLTIELGRMQLYPLYISVWPIALSQVVKTVYASPTRVNFQLDSKKEVETTPAYPDICFAIDDFDSTFDAVVLTEKDHCYCVVLNAHDGAAFPSEKVSNDCSTSGSSSLEVHSSSAKKKDTKLTLFSGFVSYQMVRDAYDDQSQEDSGPFSPVISKKAFGLGVIVRRAASAASVAARQAYAAASSSSPNFDELIPLKCSLMSISLPWEYIAYDLLFKGAPPVTM
ncbi:uncharacterized protein LOC109788673 isoform X3 [Cajanus cajan]|uniref:uncharacterized protein LOC109788673 isoform X3 n=1 Tax=Cajanus cajan TaxID=3821 RepID=UPI0010FB15DF|nr:uncharacterized protein LOC109788673 isoform X3 [Cajanus cajan]